MSYIFFNIILPTDIGTVILYTYIEILAYYNL